MLRRLTKLSNMVLFSMISVTFGSNVIAGYFWITTRIRSFELEVQNLKTDFVESQKRIIQYETEKAIDYIRYQNTLAEKRLKDSIRQRVYEAYSVAVGIWNENKETKSHSEITQMIKTALRPIRFNSGRGYYFATNLNGIEILFADRPEMEGQDLSDMQDTQGRYVIRDMIQIVKNFGEGFYQYRWTKPQVSGKDFPKIAFIKLFEPLQWFIGTGEYLDDVEKDIQKEVLERLITIRFGKEGYIFGSTYNSDPLFTGGELTIGGNNLKEVTDPKGIKIFQEYRKIVQNPEGGFLDYHWRKLTQPTPQLKTSFVKGFPEWQWIIGAGFYHDEIDDIVMHKQAVMRASIESHIQRIVLLMTLLMLFSYLVSKYIAYKIQSGFRMFSSFFDQAATQNVTIDRSRLFIEEFAYLADRANEMIEERQKAENVLAEEKELLAVTLRSIGDGVITVDTNACIVLMNRAAEIYTGWLQHEAVGRPIQEVFSTVQADKKTPAPCTVEQALRSENRMPDHSPVFLISKQGGMRTIEENTAPIRDKESRIIGAVLVFRDITDKLKIENELLRARKLESVGLLAGGIAHDFNNILTAILGNITLAKMYGTPGDKIFQRLENAEKSTLRARDLTQQLLIFAKGGDPFKIVMDICPMIQHAAEMALRDSNLKLTLSLAEDLWRVEADAGQINQVIHNIVINAKQAMSNGGELRIIAENVCIPEGDRTPITPGNYIRISIADQGVGIPEEHLSKIFDPYFTTKGLGHGLGLAVAFSIIQKHGGYIDVSSETDKGTMFCIYLPASQKPSKPVTTVKPMPPGKRKILLTDDEPMIREVSSEMFISMGYDIETACDGSEAIEKYIRAKDSGSPFDLVILDLTIPGGMGGTETIQKLLEINPHVKAVVSSGYSTDAVIANHRQYGFIGAILKPWRQDELSDMLKAVFEAA